MPAFVAAGVAVTPTTGTQTTAVAAPAGTSAGMLDVLVAVAKTETATVTTPSGYTVRQALTTLGTGAAGGNVGQVRIAVYSQELAGAATSTDVTATANVITFVRLAFSKTGGNVWAVSAAGSGSDTTSAAGYAITSDTAVDLAADDLVMIATGICDNLTAGVTTLAATGATFTITERSDTATATGNDLETVTHTATLTGSTSTAMTHDITLSAAATGGGVFIKIAETAAAAGPLRSQLVSNSSQSAAHRSSRW